MRLRDFQFCPLFPSLILPSDLERLQKQTNPLERYLLAWLDQEKILAPFNKVLIQWAPEAECQPQIGRFSSQTNGILRIVEPVPTAAVAKLYTEPDAVLAEVRDCIVWTSSVQRWHPGPLLLAIDEAQSSRYKLVYSRLACRGPGGMYHPWIRFGTESSELGFEPSVAYGASDLAQLDVARIDADALFGNPVRKATFRNGAFTAYGRDGSAIGSVKVGS